MPIQFKDTITSYARGRRGNMEEWNTISRELEGATPVYFGNPVQRGANDHGCAPFAGGEFIGVSEADLVLPRPGDSYVQYDTVGVCEVGVIGVRVAESVEAGDLAGFDATYDGNTGGWVVGDTAAPPVPGCQFETSGAAGSIVLLRVRRPVPTA